MAFPEELLKKPKLLLTCNKIGSLFIYKKYRTKHKYEITFTGTAEIVALEDDGEIFTPKFEFCTIKEILMMNVNEIVDVRGIVYVIY